MLRREASHSSRAQWDDLLQQQDRATHTLLTMAAAQGKGECVLFLLESASNPMAVLHYTQKKDKHHKTGFNALTAAIWEGHYEVANMLASPPWNLEPPSRDWEQETEYMLWQSLRS